MNQAGNRLFKRILQNDIYTTTMKKYGKNNGWVYPVFLLTFLLLGSCHFNSKEKGTENALSKEEIEEGWELLFDGKSLEGWGGIGRESAPTGRWTVEDGAIRNIGSGEVQSLADGQPEEGGDLMTVGTFDNYELSFEWKIGPAGNTGLKYNVSEEMSMQEEPKYAALGFEYQLLDDDAPEYQNELDSTQMCGALYDMIPARQKVLKPVGEYNTSRILVNGNHVEHWLNGRKVVAFDFGSNRLDSLYRQSKYKEITGFPDKRKGHLVLQNHKDDAWFRNIKIRNL